MTKQTIITEKNTINQVLELIIVYLIFSCLVSLFLYFNYNPQIKNDYLNGIMICMAYIKVKYFKNKFNFLIFLSFFCTIILYQIFQNYKIEQFFALAIYLLVASQEALSYFISRNNQENRLLPYIDTENLFITTSTTIISISIKYFKTSFTLTLGLLLLPTLTYYLTRYQKSTDSNQLSACLIKYINLLTIASLISFVSLIAIKLMQNECIYKIYLLNISLLIIFLAVGLLTKKNSIIKDVKIILGFALILILFTK